MELDVTRMFFVVFFIITIIITRVLYLYSLRLYYLTIFVLNLTSSVVSSSTVNKDKKMYLNILCVKYNGLLSFNVVLHNLYQKV